MESDNLLDFCELILGTPLEKREQGKGYLSLLQVFADGFTKLGLISDIVQGIICQLEGQSNIPAKGLDIPLLIRRAVSEDSPYPARGRNQGRGLVADDLKIILLCNLYITIAGQLRELTLRHPPGSLCHGLIDIVVTQGYNLALGLGIQIVPDKDTGLVPPQHPGRFITAANVGIIDHVIMQEGRRMDELYNTGKLYLCIPPVSCKLGCQDEQEGPEAFASARKEIDRKSTRLNSSHSQNSSPAVSVK